MSTTSRRSFLRSTAAAAGFTLGGSELLANPLGIPIGSQTYPHRQRIKDGDFAGLCKSLVDLGVGMVELCSPGYAEFSSLSDAKQTKRILDDHGLKCPSAHVSLKELRGQQDQSIAWAKEIGMTQIGTATLSAR